jgi:hypothetical protein
VCMPGTTASLSVRTIWMPCRFEQGERQRPS